MIKTNQLLLHFQCTFKLLVEFPDETTLKWLHVSRSATNVR